MEYKSMNRASFAININGVTSLLCKVALKKASVNQCLKEVFCDTLLDDERKVSNFSNVYVYSALNLVGSITKNFITCLFALLLIYSFVVCQIYVQKFIMRNSQTLIYPTMRTLRLWTLPILRKNEFLSDWHEEECLVKNPFYYELPLDCWPCEDIRTLVDLSGYANYSEDYVLNEQPFIVRDSLQKTVSFQDLKDVYKYYNLALDRGTAKFLCSEKDFCYPKDVFTKRSPSRNNFHVMWKINRVAAARVMRTLFHRPYFIPYNSEVALERYLYLSGADAPQFFLPLTDFANVWVAQGQGYRLIVLDPSVACTPNCSTVSVLLRPRDVLYYNWQFWRPRSRPANFSQDTSITFVGSFY